MKEKKIYVQFGAGNEAVPGWINFDSSPTLIIQKTPIIGRILRSKLNCLFDEAILYGDVVRGLPLQPNVVDGLFCSHVLEHLPYEDFNTALKNCIRYLKPGGVFRIIVPDLRFYIDKYIVCMNQMGSRNDVTEMPAFNFMKNTHLENIKSRSTLSRRIYEAFSNSKHQWMWYFESLSMALKKHGFIEIIRFNMGQSDDEMFLRPERAHQFGSASMQTGLAIQCKKPIEGVF